MKTEQLKEIRERLDGVTPDLSFGALLGGQLVANWPRGLWANEQVVNRDIRFHNAAHADVAALLAEVESLQKQLDQAKSRSRTWRDLYKSKRTQNRQLIDAIGEITSQISQRFGVPFEAVDRTFQAILLNAEVEDGIVETMEAIEDALNDPILQGQTPHQSEESGQ